MKRKLLEIVRVLGSTISSDGTVIVGTTGTVPMRASIQPADKKQLEALPNLRDFQQFYTLFSDTEMFTSQAGKSQADKVTIYGTQYECITCEPWQNAIRSHYKILVGR